MSCDFDDNQISEVSSSQSRLSDEEANTESENNSSTTTSEDSCGGNIENDYESAGTAGEALREDIPKKMNLRTLPSRSTRNSSSMKPNLRVSMKPARVSVKSQAALKPSQIKKIYTNQNLSRFRPTKLETIFEEPQPVRSSLSKTFANSDSDSQLRLIGPVKLKRSLTCTDGYNIKRTLIKQRRAKIKKTFGRRHRSKKIPLESFLEHMKQNSKVLAENENCNKECQPSSSMGQNTSAYSVAEVDEEEMGTTED